MDLKNVSPDELRVMINALTQYIERIDGIEPDADIEVALELRDRLNEEELDGAGDEQDEDDGQPDSRQEHADFAQDEDIHQGYDLDGGGW